MVLSDLKAGQSAYILGLTDAGALAKRLLDMGFTPGTHFTVRTCAPGGDPMLIELRFSAVILRKEEAACVLVAQPKTL